MLAAPPPAAEQRIDAPPPDGASAPEETAKQRRAREEDEEGAAEAAEKGVGSAIADVASSGVTEEVAATALKMMGINKGTTRSLFRAFRKGRR